MKKNIYIIWLGLLSSLCLCGQSRDTCSFFLRTYPLIYSAEEENLWYDAETFTYTNKHTGQLLPNGETHIYSKDILLSKYFGMMVNGQKWCIWHGEYFPANKFRLYRFEAYDTGILRYKDVYKKMDNDSLASIFENNYMDGTGYFKEFYFSGFTAYEGMLKNNRRDSLWIFYDIEGRIEKTIRYDSGTAIDSTLYPSRKQVMASYGDTDFCVIERKHMIYDDAYTLNPIRSATGQPPLPDSLYLVTDYGKYNSEEIKETLNENLYHWDIYRPMVFPLNLSTNWQTGFIRNGHKEGYWQYIFKPQIDEYLSMTSVRKGSIVYKVEHYENGLLDGAFYADRTYFGPKSRDSIVSLFETTFSQGTGYYKDFDFRGRLIAEGAYNSGYKEGTWHLHDYDKMRYYRQEYRKGKLIRQKKRKIKTIQ